MNFDLAFYWKLFCRRLPVMLLFILVCSGFGVATALKSPETWSTSARLLVEAPQIPDEMVASTIQTEAKEQLDIIEQKLMTRANLIDIANNLKVFANIRNMEPDSVVARMRGSTSIRRTTGRERATLMTISFQGRSGEIAAKVVNEYVTLVLQENVDFRVSRAESTLSFFTQEVERLNAELAEQGARIALFRSDNAEALPSDQSYRLGRQTLLQERLSRLEREQGAILNQRDEVVRIFEATGRLSANGNAQRRTPQQQQLIVEQAELDHAIETFGEDNPRVTRQRARVARLEAIVQAQQKANLPVVEGEEGSAEKALLEATLAQLDTRLNLVEEEINGAKTQLANLQESISKSSANGIELDVLEREYRNIQARYNAAVNNLNAAQMSERVESTAQGQRITVIENASVPKVPTGPDRPKIAIMGAALGFGLAAAFFALLELLNGTVRRPAELIGKFNVTPITTIPYMESRGRRMLRRGGILVATLVVLIGVPAALWYIDTNYLPLELVVQKGLSKLGLG